MAMTGKREDPAERMRIRDLLDASGVLGIPDRLLPRGVRVARAKGGAVLFSEVDSGEQTARFTHLIVEREDLRQACEAIADLHVKLRAIWPGIDAELDRLAGGRHMLPKVVVGTDPNGQMVVLDAVRDDWGVLFCSFLSIPPRRLEVQAPASFLESLAMASDWRASFVEAGFFVHEELYQAGSSNANLDGFLLIASETRVLVAFWDTGVRVLEQIIGYRPRWGYVLTLVPFWPN
jgi:hypothetical protein